MKFPYKKNDSLHISSNPLIDCVNLRVLELLGVHISEDVFHNLLSTFKLLERINLRFTEGLEKIKVNNLHYLQELKIAPTKQNDIFDIYDVPSLRSFHYIASMLLWVRPVLFKMDSIGSLRELYLMDVYFDDAFSDMINSKFPFLESLTLKIKHCKVGIMDIRCATLRRLEIQSWQRNPIKVQVNAPKLLFYLHRSVSMPSLLFPTMAPEQIELSVMLNDPIDHLLFLKMRETLNLSSKFNIAIQSNFVALVPFNIDDVRTRVPFPATNVEKLLFETCYLWDSLLLFDAFFSRANGINKYPI
ncbi:F-box protein-like protein [Tanacetum coccineum]